MQSLFLLVPTKQKNNLFVRGDTKQGEGNDARILSLPTKRPLVYLHGLAYRFDVFKRPLNP
jgi:hypothetical protein